MRIWDDYDDESDPRWELFWGAMYLALGGSIIMFMPPSDSGAYLFIGGGALLIGLVFLIRFTLGWVDR